MSLSIVSPVVLFLLLCGLQLASANPRIMSVPSAPRIVMWHGMGDTCCSPMSLGKIDSLLKQQIPGVYVHSLKLGKSVSDDLESGYFANVNEEVATACRLISSDPELRGGYHAIGFSQGGQFLRAVAQRCPEPRMKNLITLGAQHQGVNALPRCSGSNQTLCALMRKIMNFGAYTSFVQRHSVQAQYWHDPLDLHSYREKSIFLADINNEREPRNQSYVDNLNRLQNLVMVQFAGDTIVTPRESETFGFYAPGQIAQILPMNETDLYREDRIGLKRMDESGRVAVYVVPGNHLQLDLEWFTHVLIAKYLKNP